MKTSSKCNFPFFYITLGLILSSCGPSMSIYSDYDRDADFKGYQNYRWELLNNMEAERNPLYYNELMDKRIKEAVDLQLKIRNYRLVNDRADLVMHYHIVMEDQMQVSSDPYGYYGPYWRRSNVSVIQHKEGTLIIDMMDAQSKNLLWRGWAVSAFDPRDPEKTEARIKQAVVGIFDRFPYKAMVINP